jgi:MFS transporter, DHA1 family, putative efflux transporter
VVWLASPPSRKIPPMDLTARRSTTALAIGWLTVFVVGTDLFVISPLLPLVAAGYRISTTLAGLSITVFSLAYVIGAPLIGHFADRLGRRRILTLCLAAFAIANLLTGLAQSFAWLLLTRIFAGAAAAGVSPSVYALVGTTAPPERRATRLSLVVSGLLLALPLGTPAATLAGAAFGWRSAFVGLGAAAFALAWANRSAWPEPPAESERTSPVSRKAAGITGRLAPMLAWSTALYGMYTYLGAGLSAAGLSTAATAHIIVFYGAGAIAGLLLGGRLADRFGTRTTANLSLGGLFIAFLLLRLAIGAGVLPAAALVVTSATAQVFFPAQQAGLVEDFPANRAAVLAWNNSILFLGISLGSLIGGQAMAVGGFSANLLVSAAVVWLGWAIHRRVTPTGPASGGKPAGQLA